jgi:hypothetical protein
MSIGQTTWRAGRRERCRKAAVSGDRADMACVNWCLKLVSHLGLIAIPTPVL